MTSQLGLIHLLRHGEAAHNVSKNFHHHDPPLTEAGIAQGKNLTTAFPHHSRVGLVVTSPLTRTIQTSLAGFSPILDSGAAKLVVDPDVQERSGYLCDTGSDTRVLKEAFPGVDFSHLANDWHLKVGPYAADPASVTARAARLRKSLKKRLEELGGKDIVVAMHGGIMQEVLEDKTVDLPKAGWISVKFDGDSEKLVKAEI